MRIEQLEYFVAAARSLSFTEAAKECYVAQPAISQQIRLLESELGFDLFERRTRGLALTEAGKAYYADAMEILTRLQTARDSAFRIAHGSKGVLTVGTAGATQASDLALFDDFHIREPLIDLEFKVLRTRVVGEQLQRGEFDVLYVDTTQLACLPDVAFTCVDSFDLCVMASRKNAIAHRRSVTYREISSQTLIFAEQSNMANQQSIVADLLRNGAEVIFVDTQDNVQLLVRLNRGITLAPESVATAATDDITLVPTSGAWPKIDLGWAYLKSNENPALKVFLGYLAETRQQRA